MSSSPESSPIRYTHDELESIGERIKSAQVSAALKSAINAVVIDSQSVEESIKESTELDEKDAKIAELEVENKWLRKELQRSETELVEVTNEIVGLHQKNEELKHENQVKQGLINTLMTNNQAQQQAQYVQAQQQNQFTQAQTQAEALPLA